MDTIGVWVVNPLDVMSQGVKELDSQCNCTGTGVKTSRNGLENNPKTLASGQTVIPEVASNGGKTLTVVEPALGSRPPGMKWRANLARRG